MAISIYINESKKGGKQASRLMEEIESWIDQFNENPKAMLAKIATRGRVKYIGSRGWSVSTDAHSSIEAPSFYVNHYGEPLVEVGPDDGGAVYYIRDLEAASSWSDKTTVNRIREAINYLNGNDGTDAVI